MTSLGDELAAAGKPVAEDDMMSFILAGLDVDYNPLLSALEARTESVTLGDLYGQIANFDTHMELLNGGGGGFKSSAKAAARGPGGYGHGHGGSQRGRGGRSNNRGGGRFPVANRGGRQGAGRGGGNNNSSSLSLSS